MTRHSSKVASSLSASAEISSSLGHCSALYQAMENFSCLICCDFRLFFHDSFPFIGLTGLQTEKAGA
jgi:hypothetical protein